MGRPSRATRAFVAAVCWIGAASAAGAIGPVDSPLGDPMTSDVVVWRVDPPVLSGGGGAPDTLRIELALATSRDESTVVELHRRSVRGANYEVVADVTRREVPSTETYQGWVVGDPATRVAATLRAGELRATFFPRVGGAWRLRSVEPGALLTEAPGRYRVEPVPEAGAPEADSSHAEEVLHPSLERAPFSRGGSCGVVRAELALDCSFTCFEQLGSDVDAVMDLFEETVNELNAVYVRDMRVEYVLGRTVIRTDAASDPYFGVPFFDKLDLVQQEWENNQPGSDHDQAALVDGDGPGSGLAWVGTVCTSLAYSINGFDAFAVMRHELGHNWGAGHFAGGSPEGPTIMSGNSINRFSGPEKDEMTGHRDSRTCVDELGPYPLPVPPYAHFDDVIAPRCGSEPIDVLANDEDANCHPLSIASWDSPTELGGEVLLDGERLAYTGPVAGIDTFTYTVVDPSGIESEGNVRVEVVDPTRIFLGVESADSEQSGEEATSATDGDLNTFWHTMYFPELDPLPHEIVLDLGFERRVTGVDYWPRQDGGVNGHIGSYELYLSNDPSEWGSPAATGALTFSSAKKTIPVPESPGRFVRLVALTEANGGPWTSAAEFEVLTVETLRPPEALFAVDSEQPGFEAELALDGDPGSYWHTEFSPNVPPLPHQIEVDLGVELEISELVYLPRQDGGVNGTILDYEVYTSLDGALWTLAMEGEWPMDTTEKRASFPPVRARYGRLVATREYSGGPWTSAAEIDFVAAELGLMIENLVSGEVATFSATGSTPGRVVGFAASLDGEGCGPCVPGSGSACLGLEPPILRLGTSVAASDGVASLNLPLPAGFDGRKLSVQAFELEGVLASRLSPVLVRTLGP